MLNYEGLLQSFVMSIYARFFNDKNYEFEKKYCCAILISFLVRQQSLGDGCICIYVCSVN